MGTMNAEGIASIAHYKDESLVEMMKVATETETENAGAAGQGVARQQHSTAPIATERGVTGHI